MTEWVVAGIVITIIGGGWAVVNATAGIIRPLTEQITKLNESIKSITKDLTDMANRNSKTHDRLFSSLKEHDDVLNDHEVRLTVLEEHNKE